DDHPDLQAPLMDFWVARYGVAAALVALQAACALERRCDVGGSGRPEALWLARVESTGGFGRAPEAWKALRRHLAGVDDGAYREALDAARSVRIGATVRMRAALAYAFPEETDWSREEALKQLETVSRWSASGKGTFYPDECLLASLADPEVAERYLLACHCETPDFPLTLADRLGDSVVAGLLRFLSGDRRLYGAARLHCAAVIVCEELGQVMLEILEEKDQKRRQVAMDYFLGAPRLALNLLSGTPRRNAAARTLLAALVRSHPALVEEVLPGLPPAQREVLEALRQRAEPVAEAAETDLPAVLRQPPWLGPRRRRLPLVVEGVRLVDHPEQVLWQEGERAERPHWSVPQYRGADAGTVAQLQSRVAAGEDVQVWPGILEVLEEEPALELWNNLDCRPSFGWLDEVDTRTILRRLGPRSIPGFLDRPEILLQRVRSARVAPVAARGLTQKRWRRLARQWLVAHPEAAAVGLIPQAVGPLGEERGWAEAALRRLARGHGAMVLAVADRYGPAVREAVDEVLSFDPRHELPDKLPRLPGFFDPEALPRPVLREGRGALPRQSVEHLGLMLAVSQPETPYAGLADLREACDPASLAEFAWQLFQAWYLAGAPPREAWAFYALGHLGDDQSARRLAPLLRAWPAEGFHARAVMGLEVLRGIGTERALMLLHGIAQRARHAGIQARAQETIENVAAELGLSADDLADRLVPDLGLERDGSRTLDYGPRSFRVAFDSHLEPEVVDQDGRRIGDLPKPGKRDDAALAKAARQAWTELKAEARRILKHHLLRLELAMISRRTFRLPVFRACLAEHPFMQHIARRLVWGVLADNGQLQGCLRVCEDGSLADSEDSALQLPEEALLILPHRLELEEATLQRWSTILGDHRILQPFPQVGREVYRPSDPSEKAVRTVEGLRVPAARILSLEQRGWRRGPAGNSGVVSTFVKPLGKDGEAELDFEEGWVVGDLAGAVDSDQTLGLVRLPLAAGEIPPVAYSELVYDLRTLSG
ncbi:MAG: DUF4132 domain-containing protein, partial [Candidatus Eremiobacterota bacterium]